MHKIKELDLVLGRLAEVGSGPGPLFGCPLLLRFSPSDECQEIGKFEVCAPNAYLISFSRTNSNIFASLTCIEVQLG